MVQDLADQRTAEPPIGYRLHLASEIPNFAPRRPPGCRCPAGCPGATGDRGALDRAISAVCQPPAPEQGLDLGRAETGLEAVARRLFGGVLEVRARAERVAGARRDAAADVVVVVDAVPCSTISAIISPLSALRRSGRFIVTIRV